MLIAIISDTHDNLPNLKKVLDYCRRKKVAKLIHCGDLATFETLDFINNNFSGEIFFTFGNMDDGHIAHDICHPELVSGSAFKFESGNIFYKNTQIFPDFGKIEIADKKVAFVHYPTVAKQLCETGEFDFVFHGHTHKPWTEVINNYTLLNPGNVANQYYPPTFAIWNTDTNLFQLIRINELPQ